MIIQWQKCLTSGVTKGVQTAPLQGVQIAKNIHFFRYGDFFYKLFFMRGWNYIVEEWHRKHRVTSILVMPLRLSAYLKKGVNLSKWNKNQDKVTHWPVGHIVLNYYRAPVKSWDGPVSLTWIEKIKFWSYCSEQFVTPY